MSRQAVPALAASLLTVGAVAALALAVPGGDDAARPAHVTRSPVLASAPLSPSPTPPPTPATPTPHVSTPAPAPTPTEYVRAAGWDRSTVTSPEVAGATKIAVLVETGVPVDAGQAARLILTTLSDPRGWGGKGYAFSLVDSPEAATVTIRIASPATTTQGCQPLDTEGYTSCSLGHAVWLNSDRWLYAVPGFNGDTATYRTYVISHEVGHSLGYHHVHCAAPGLLAPVMQQQTLDLEGCLPNGWVTLGHAA